MTAPAVATLTDKQLWAAAWAELRQSDISVAEWQRRVDGGYKGKPYAWQNTHIGKAKLLGDQIDAQPPPSTAGCYWGARIDGAFYGTTSDAPWGAESWDLFEQHAGKKVSLIHWGGSGSELIPFDQTANKLCHDRGAFSLYSMGISNQQIRDLATGSNWQGTISKAQAWALQAAQQGWPLMLRPMWEMNGNWGYQWQTNQGIPAGTYVSAWRRLHQEITHIAPNVSFHWCPNIKNAAVADPSPWFPGDSYVDWLGFDGYVYSTYMTPEDLFGPTRDTCLSLSSKPLMIGETGCESPTSTPGKAAWITAFLTWLQENPTVKGFAWFNEAGNPKLPHIEAGAGAQDAFRVGIANPYFLANVSAGQGNEET